MTYAAGTNRLLTSPRGNYYYGADGNPSTDGYLNYLYDSYGRLTTLQTDSDRNVRTYNGQGLRVKAVGSAWSGNTPLQAPAAPPTPPQRLTTTRSISEPTGNSTAMMRKAGPGKNIIVGGGSPGRWVVNDTRHYFHADDGQLLGEYSVTTGYKQETIWFNGAPVATMINGVLYNVRADNLGTPRSIARASDNLEVWRWDSDPFGNTVPVAPSPPNAIVYNLRFPGQQYDNYSGYYYNVMRDYDPYTGRYLEADPAGLAGGMSRYSYVGGNALLRTDPSGLYWFRQEWQASGVVGRGGTPIEPGGSVSNLIETRVPAGYTFGQMHDSFVDSATKAGVPDLIANIPSMPVVFVAAVFTEILRSLGVVGQPKPESAQCK